MEDLDLKYFYKINKNIEVEKFMWWNLRTYQLREAYDIDFEWKNTWNFGWNYGDILDKNRVNLNSSIWSKPMYIDHFIEPKKNEGRFEILKNLSNDENEFYKSILLFLLW